MAFDRAKYIATLERILQDNILAFWVPAVLDAEYGGYRTIEHDGSQTVGQSKPVIAQARTLWFFSHLINCGRTDDRHLQAARSGFDFLRTRMWDFVHGGFYWEVDSTGREVLVDLKHIYAQALALYALSEYAMATGDPVATSLAGDLYDYMDRHCHDSVYAGYREIFNRDWSAYAQVSLDSADTNWLLFLSARRPTQKTYNSHLHLLEAVTNFYRLSPEPRVRNRLFELVLIMSNGVNRKNGNGCAGFFERDWRQQADPFEDTVVYGHDLENITLLSYALDALAVPQPVLMEYYVGLFDNALRHGFDTNRGGFHQSGPPGEPANRRQKYAWVQGEGLLSALQMFRHSGDAVYVRCFDDTLNWINEFQINWTKGDWHNEISPDVEVVYASFESWHSPYHHGRAVLNSLMLLESWPENTS